MNACFADTFFFIALLFEKDEAHAKAQTLAAELGRRMYTSQVGWVYVAHRLLDRRAASLLIRPRPAPFPRPKPSPTPRPCQPLPLSLHANSSTHVFPSRVSYNLAGQLPPSSHLGGCGCSLCK